MTILLLLIPALPLLAALLVPFLGRRAAGPTACAACGISLLLSALLLFAGGETALSAGWGTTGGIPLTIGLRFDALSGPAALLVAGVSFFVLLYSLGYMAEEEEGKPRYFAGMSFFVGGMLTLVLADSLILLFAAWEWVGLASWLLIGFHYREAEASAAARKAFLVTRAGDAAFFLGWLIALAGTGSADISAFLAQVQGGGFPTWLVTLLGLLFLAGALGKSAQLPLSAWLPPAMAGPTPVSALIHSATMVAAGVYLLLRLWPLFETSPAVLGTVLWVGGITALAAALTATAQRDLKRVLAWSTVSQLGEMMLALGLAGPLAAAFHLGTHALFKSSLFMAAGAIDHAAGTRDLRELGNLWRTLPWTSGAFALAALALAGFPPFSGFWSEEEILAAATAAPLAAGCLLLTIFLAGVYIGRAAMAALGPRPGMPPPRGEEPGKAMLGPLVVLALLGAGVGWFLKTPLEEALPFAAGHGLGWGWRGAAIAASLLGLGFGVWRVRRVGPAPALGSWPSFLEKGAAALVAGPAQGTLALSRVIERLEGGFDALARGAGCAVPGLARWVDGVESGLDALAQGGGRAVPRLARGVDGVETGFDAAGRGCARAALGLAAGSEEAEARGFGSGGDAFARLLGHAGGGLRDAETGKVFLYNLGFFVWVLVLAVVGLVLLL